MSLQTNRIAVVAVFLAVLGIAIYAFVSSAILQIRLSFAADQIETFHAMAEKAVAADAESAARDLEYLMSYYPSGTKQATGTKLDLLVESARQHSAKRIIEHLRRITGRDLGDDPKVWISAYAVSDGVVRQ